jgi:hypothetical protein
MNNICERRACPSPCAEGQRCVEQQCVTPCVVDSQCSADEICNSEQRRCVPDDGTSGINSSGGTTAGAEAGTESGGMSGGSNMSGTESSNNNGAGGGNTAGFLVEPPATMTGGSASADGADSGASCQANQRSSGSWLCLLVVLIFMRRRQFS